MERLQFTLNHSNLNIVDGSGALFTLRIHYEYTQCEEGARDVNDIWVTVVTSRKQKFEPPLS